MLRRLLAYGRRVYALERDLDAVRDRRRAGRIPTRVFVRGLFVMAAARVGSLYALAQSEGSGFWSKWVGGRPGDDRMRDEAELLEVADLRAGVSRAFYRRRRRNKSLPPFRNGLSGLILDGHECRLARQRARLARHGGASYRRHCPQCLTRTATTKRRDGTQRSRTQEGRASAPAYYHRPEGRASAPALVVARPARARGAQPGDRPGDARRVRARAARDPRLDLGEHAAGPAGAHARPGAVGPQPLGD